jgi:hypothetical protein
MIITKFIINKLHFSAILFLRIMGSNSTTCFIGIQKSKINLKRDINANTCILLNIAAVFNSCINIIFLMLSGN